MYRECINQTLVKREINIKDCQKFSKCQQVTPYFISRLGLEKELEGHHGCVNCLSWNGKGNLLASGSDDLHLIIWDPFKHKKLFTYRTVHCGNIFSVEFLPNSEDNILISGAADSKIQVLDVNRKEQLHVITCHLKRVKRIVVSQDQPFLFWSASEDGTVMQFDLRDPESFKAEKPRCVLINLNKDIWYKDIWPGAEIKCLSINPVFPELLALGSNDSFARLYDRRMLHCQTMISTSLDDQRLVSENGDSNRGCIDYFVPGHLKDTLKNYQNNHRTLATTHITFSPNGRELLVNLGGEQIYLFDLNKKRKQTKLNFILNSISQVDNFKNGAIYKISTKANEIKNLKLLTYINEIRRQAKSLFDTKHYNKAICLYNRVLAISSDQSVLYCNRAVALFKRNWDGDVYAAIRDCSSAIQLDPFYFKAFVRLAMCFQKLNWPDQTKSCINIIKERFPENAKSQSVILLEREVNKALKNNKETKKEKNFFEYDLTPMIFEDNTLIFSNPDNLSETEKSNRNMASDYEQRFCGHCNTTTDIKEANYFGSNGQYIVAGSDDGSFFIWDKETANIERILKGDDSIVNCLQPHPTNCLLATSGIDPVVRLWSPRPVTGKKDLREVDNCDDAANANQRRMNTDPIEIMLINMGYRFSNSRNNQQQNNSDG